MVWLLFSRRAWSSAFLVRHLKRGNIAAVAAVDLLRGRLRFCRRLYGGNTIFILIIRLHIFSALSLRLPPARSRVTLPSRTTLRLLDRVVNGVWFPIRTLLQNLTSNLAPLIRTLLSGATILNMTTNNPPRNKNLGHLVNVSPDVMSGFPQRLPRTRQCLL